MKEDYQSIKIIGLQSCIDILEERFAVMSGPNFLLISSTKNSTFKPPKLYAIIYAINMLNKMRSIVVDNLTHLCRYVHLRIFQISFLRWEKKWRKKNMEKKTPLSETRLSTSIFSSWRTYVYHCWILLPPRRLLLVATSCPEDIEKNNEAYMQRTLTQKHGQK